MSTEDHIWALVAKRLASEASEDELQELDKLLKQHADIDKRVKIMADWWHEGNEDETAHRGALLFERIKQKISVKENEKSIPRE